jgi:eight-cysteine-cluster-containing protein
VSLPIFQGFQNFPLVLLLACACTVHGVALESEPSPSVIAEVASAPSTLPVVAPSAEAPDPRALYDGCRNRLERPESDGECSKDEDCGRAGCSQEVCTTQARAAEVITTCAVLPCFSVLDRCGCVDGKCTWTLKEAGQVGFGRPMPGLQAP